ncbi:hypothetical protein RvY_07899 [Ramazzottius varieornatus]|uniref:G-protein coupled receptors family 1 profile domain-containing protein n=1 Tax=Ramazzottius varieornatus TaxID=947166 RepID=A0A1D1V9T5_RAMVA|nr:hypothetical protein RvY_07899 [Ramazzottius varieornatus]
MAEDVPTLLPISLTSMQPNQTYEDSIRELGFDVVSWRTKVIVLSIMYVAGLIGNGIVFVMLLRRRLGVSPAIRHVILNLVVADIFVVNFCILTLAVWHYTVQWMAGDLMCRISKYLQMFSLYASTFIVVVISMDRCIAIVSPLNMMDKQKWNQRLANTAWALAAIFSIPQAVIFRVQKAPTSEFDFYQCVTFGAYTENWQEPLYTTFTLLVNFLLPLIIIISCYALILYKLFSNGLVDKRADPRTSATNSYLREVDFTASNGIKRSSSVSQPYNVHDNPSLSIRSAKLRKARTTSFWISVLIVTTFLICWGPYYVRMVGSFVWENSVDEHVDNFVFFFGIFNSVLNPVIYGAFHIFSRASRHNRSGYISPRERLQQACHQRGGGGGTHCQTDRSSPSFFRECQYIDISPTGRTKSSFI